MKDIVTNGLADHYAWDGVNHDKFAGSIHDDLRFTVRAIKANDGEQAIFSLCRALGDDTEAAEVVRNEWRRK